MTQPDQMTPYRLGKRALDLLGGMLGLFVLGLVYLPIALAIRLDSPGPILFAQPRVGRRGKLFSVFKFRTMHAGAPRLGKLPSESDGRVTRMGRFLRRTGLDELPQVVNVLRGEMSLVGPRPELPELFAAYAPWQQRRVEVFPGLTGWWQVNGRWQPMQEHIDLDIYYVEHQSLALDLLILLKTVPALFRPEARFAAAGTSGAGDREAPQPTAIRRGDPRPLSHGSKPR